MKGGFPLLVHSGHAPYTPMSDPRRGLALQCARGAQPFWGGGGGWHDARLCCGLQPAAPIGLSPRTLPHPLGPFPLQPAAPIGLSPLTLPHPLGPFPLQPAAPIGLSPLTLPHPLGPFPLQPAAPIGLSPLTLPHPLGPFPLQPAAPIGLSPLTLPHPLGPFPLQPAAPIGLSPRTLPRPLGPFPLQPAAPIGLSPLTLPHPLGPFPLQPAAPIGLSPLTLPHPLGPFPLQPASPIGLSPLTLPHPLGPFPLQPAAPIGPSLPPHRPFLCLRHLSLGARRPEEILLRCLRRRKEPPSVGEGVECRKLTGLALGYGDAFGGGAGGGGVGREPPSPSLPSSDSLHRPPGTPTVYHDCTLQLKSKTRTTTLFGGGGALLHDATTGLHAPTLHSDNTTLFGGSLVQRSTATQLFNGAPLSHSVFLCPCWGTTRDSQRASSGSLRTTEAFTGSNRPRSPTNRLVSASQRFAMFPVGEFSRQKSSTECEGEGRGCGKMGEMGKLSQIVPFLYDFLPFPINFTRFLYISQNVFLAISHNSPISPHFPKPLRLIGQFGCGQRGSLRRPPRRTRNHRGNHPGSTGQSTWVKTPALPSPMALPLHPPPSSVRTRHGAVKPGKSGGSVGTTSRGEGRGSGAVKIGRAVRGRAQGGERPMGAAGCRGKGPKGRGRVSGERPMGAAGCRPQHNRASCQPPPPPPRDA